MKIKELLTRGVEEIIVKEHLESALLSGRKLRVKFGIDPTAPDLHLGHTIPLRKLRQFQELGHQAVLIIGDFTATIGDPSGRSEARRSLTSAQVEKNMSSYLDQASKVIDIKKVEVRYNSDWYKKWSISQFYELISKITIQQALERDDFRKRLKEGRNISILEVIYPLLQGYDSVMVNADVEIGGTDQKFNLLMGRRVQRAYGIPEQDIITLPLLEGTDGIHKMSKSFGNHIPLTLPPEEMYGKIMSIPDDLIVKYFLLLTDVPMQKVEQMLKESKQPDFDWKPREKKAWLAREIVTMYHNKEEALKAEKEFENIFSKGKLPTKIPTKKIDKKESKLVDLLTDCNLTLSKSEARRLIDQGAVEINGKVIKDKEAKVKIKNGMVIRVGKRKFMKLLV